MGEKGERERRKRSRERERERELAKFHYEPEFI